MHAILKATSLYKRVSDRRLLRFLDKFGIVDAF